MDQQDSVIDNLRRFKNLNYNFRWENWKQAAVISNYRYTSLHIFSCTFCNSAQLQDHVSQVNPAQGVIH